MRLLICAGGTGGGAYPAVAVVQALSARHADVEILWVGSEAGMEAELVSREGIAFRSIPAAGLHGVSVRALPGNAWQIMRGISASRAILGDFRPQVLFFTGGFLAGPMAIAGRAVPTLLYVPDIEPGLALKALARFADTIAVTSDESKRYFSKKVVVTGYPTRRSLARWTRDRGRAALGLAEDLPVVLVAGGSKGARSINQSLINHLPNLLNLAQVVHVAGLGEWESVAEQTASLSASQAGRYHLFPYLHDEMGAALAAADIAILRAGASVLGELPLFGLPGILVPYPHAWRYQRVNADYLQRRGAAVVIRDDDLSTLLYVTVQQLLQDTDRQRKMQAAMRSLARPEAAEALADQVLELGGHRL